MTTDDPREAPPELHRGHAHDAAGVVDDALEASAILRRVLDGTDEATVPLLEEVAAAVPGVEHVTSAKARWTGHALNAELEIQVEPTLTVKEGHAIAEEVEHALLHAVPRLRGATVHVDPHGHGPHYSGPMAHHREP